MNKVLDMVVEILKMVNHGNSRFPSMLEGVLFKKDHSGLTALHHAVRSGNKISVRWCMLNGAVACPPQYQYPNKPFCGRSSKNVAEPSNLKSLIAEGSSKLTQGATLWECVVLISQFELHVEAIFVVDRFCRYRVWRSEYDKVSLQKYTKFEFRQLWKLFSGQHGIENEQVSSSSHPLEVAELHSLSGSNYEFMVARAMNLASVYMLPVSSTAASLQYPDHSDKCDCSFCQTVGNKRKCDCSFCQTVGNKRNEFDRQANAKQSNDESKIISFDPQANANAKQSNDESKIISFDPQANAKQSNDKSKIISPFDLALCMLYVHSVEKHSLNTLNKYDQQNVEAKQRFVAALDVVEQMIEIDDERLRRSLKISRKQTLKDSLEISRKQTSLEISRKQTLTDQWKAFAPRACGWFCSQQKQDEQNHNSQPPVTYIKSHCKSARRHHEQFYSKSMFSSLAFAACFCVLVIFCAMWMTSSVSAELSQWQTFISTEFSGDNAQLRSSYRDFSEFHSDLAKFSVPWPPDSSFTRAWGSTELRVIRFKTQPSSECFGLDNLACVPSLSLFASISLSETLPSSALSSTPSSFLVPPYSRSFVYQQRADHVRCGSVYCFDGSGYTFQASNASEFTAAVQSSIFDANVRALIVSFAMYSPSLQAAYVGSFLAEMLPTGSVLVMFDNFVVDFAGAKKLQGPVVSWYELLWVLKIIVSAHRQFFVFYFE
jgi:hypothetical protein